MELAPRALGRLSKGMPKDEVDRILGPPIFSPTAGQFYYNTGGECPLNDDANNLVSCAVVADYRVTDMGTDPPPTTVTGVLEECWWGAVGE